VHPHLSRIDIDIDDDLLAAALPDLRVRSLL
jgi:Arc/MetJ family transcription regulator